MSQLPPYYDTLKGKIIQAIAISSCYDFRSIQSVTGISTNQLQNLINELLAENILCFWEDSKNLKVTSETYWIWFNFFMYGPDFTLRPDIIPKKDESVEGIIGWIQSWVNFYKKEYKLMIPVGTNHFYLDGPLLIDFLSSIIKRADKQIIVFTPWIENINLTKLLVRSCESNCEVLVITRQPKYNARREWEIKQAQEQSKCHEELKNAGVEIRLRNDIHSKVMLVDKQIAIISSFNFTRNPASGTSWEAGIITYEKNVVEGIIKSIDNYLSDK